MLHIITTLQVNQIRLGKKIIMLSPYLTPILLNAKMSHHVIQISIGIIFQDHLLKSDAQSDSKQSSDLS
jgi:hypothetical protein